MPVWRRPEVALLVAAAAAALIAPQHRAGGVGVVAVLVIVGAWLGPQLARPWPALSKRSSGAIAVAAVAIAGLVVFARVLFESRGWTYGDWGPQRAVLDELIPALESGHLPDHHWRNALSTGEAPLETYPAMTYLLVAITTIVTGMQDDLSTLLMTFAIATHVLLAIGVTRVAVRIAPAPLAAGAGIFVVLDPGSIGAGGVSGTLMWGVLHNAVGQVFALAAICAVIDAVHRPRLTTSIRIWLWCAVAAATHPATLITLAAVGVALLAVAAFARDVPPRRPLCALGHLALGIALAAVVWMPTGERILVYGQHFSHALHGASQMFGELLSRPFPTTSFAAIVFAGHVGVFAALWSRRAAPILCGAAAVVILLAFCDAPYLVLDAGPSPGLARLGVERLHAVVKPFVFACAAYIAGLVLAHVIAGWRDAPVRALRVAGALIALAGALGLRATTPWLGEQVDEIHGMVRNEASAAGQAQLVAWARREVAQMTPDRYARAMFDMGDVHFNYHLTAETGLPTFHLGATANILLRERIEDATPASLHRFDVRWVITRDTGSAIGDEATEQRFGPYVVREIPGWDGKPARIERGTGAVRVTRFDDDRIDVELTGTDQPALVALGIGYWPRWRARDTGGDVAVYAMPSIPGGELRVVAAWLRPGVTTFTPDGPLPSDGTGRGLSLAALIAVLAIGVAWSRPRWRYRVLRRWVALRERARGGGPRAIAIATIVAAIALPAWALMSRGRVVDGLEVGAGVRSIATVRARHVDGDWRECDYHAVTARYRCDTIVEVRDVFSNNVVNDAQPDWPFTAPAIHVEALDDRPVEVEVAIEGRFAGEYWVASANGSARFEIPGVPPIITGATRHDIVLDDGHRRVVVTAPVPPENGVWLAMVRVDAIQPPRPHLVAPPEAPPR